MSVLWPRLPEPVALEEYEKVRAGSELRSAGHHPEQVYAPVGERVESSEITRLADEVGTLASLHGFPAAVPDASKIAFDRSCASLLRGLMDVTWAEAGTRSIWSFVALVPLPQVTHWRFGVTNVERWVATDLTRHTWARLWWQAVVFESDPELLGLLTESDLNQLLERRSIGGDPRLVRSIGRALVQSDLAGIPRRTVIRDVTPRLRRHLAFVDVRALDDRTLIDWCSYLVGESVAGIRQLSQSTR
ncbi:hypothetical protein ACIA58_18955 [Kribbella sp. NPDC051586]|uniref:hypothetical protein n=1 Tax=Kribbella sp. NPDC051586 TaxID=3364118 RepID=UPI003791EFD8